MSEVMAHPTPAPIALLQSFLSLSSHSSVGLCHEILAFLYSVKLLFKIVSIRFPYKLIQARLI